MQKETEKSTKLRVNGPNYWRAFSGYDQKEMWLQENNHPDVLFVTSFKGGVKWALENVYIKETVSPRPCKEPSLPPHSDVNFVTSVVANDLQKCEIINCLFCEFCGFYFVFICGFFIQAI